MKKTKFSETQIIVSIRANTYCNGFLQVLPLAKNYEKVFHSHERVKIQRDLHAI
jgi:hypothetical protein